MKPDWKDAPEWAKFLAMDEGGYWWWYEEEPSICGDEWYSPCRKACAGESDIWRESLESCP